MSNLAHFDRPTRLEAMRRLLEQRPPAAVVAIADTGLFTTMPDGVPVDGHPLLEGGSGIELVHPADRKGLVDGWLRMLTCGLARVTVDLVTGDRAAFCFLDLREDYGTILGILVPETSSPRPEDLERAADVAPRLGHARLDERGTLLEVDGALSRMLDHTAEAVVGTSSVDLIPPEDHASAIGNWMEMLANPGQSHRWRGRYRRGDGSLLWLEAINTNRLADPEHRDVLAEFIDISEEMAALEALRASELLLRRLTEALPEAVVQVDDARRIVHANGRLDEMFGGQPSELLDDRLRPVLGRDWPILDAAIAAMLAGTGEGDLEFHVEDGGQVRVFEFVLRCLVDRAGAPLGGIVCVSDVTERARLHAELEVRATYDALTGCQNRASIMATLDRVLASASGTADGTAVAFLDIDRFKTINDRLGHAAGDELLVLVASRLRAAIRSNDAVGRLGGDEFVVVCPGISGIAKLRRLGSRLGGAVGQPAVIAGQPLSPRASIGVSWMAAGRRDLDRLVAAADGAMYRAKSTGTGRPVVTVAPAGADEQVPAA